MVPGPQLSVQPQLIATIERSTLHYPIVPLQ
ncbi:hypothetical protein SGPA1_11563 [Streptomyces misionensis JCM 4497]